MVLITFLNDVKILCPVRRSNHKQRMTAFLIPHLLGDSTIKCVGKHSSKGMKYKRNVRDEIEEQIFA